MAVSGHYFPAGFWPSNYFAWPLYYWPRLLPEAGRQEAVAEEDRFGMVGRERRQQAVVAEDRFTEVEGERRFFLVPAEDRRGEA